MIQLTKLRELTLTAPSHPQRHDYLCAASGLVKVGGFFYVVTDDENHLGVFPSGTDAPGRLIRLFPGTLPVTKKKRKRKKPDLEALVCLPPFAECSTGALLCVPSGSTPNRCIGALLAIDGDGAVVRKPISINLTATYDGLRTEIPTLNIEGATVIDDSLVLMQRGNHRGSRNACIHFRLPDVLENLGSTHSLGALAPTAIEFVDLGDVDRIPLCFSDVAAVPGVGLAFVAIAEDTDDNYLDGPCVGAAIGIIDVHGQVRHMERLLGAPKVEGIHAELVGQMLQLWLVTDADDENTPAQLLVGEICVG